MVKEVGLCVPVYKNFQGFTELIHSVDIPVMPLIIDNWNDNKGVSKAWNIGLQRAVAMNLDALFIVNDDVVLERFTMRKMLIGLAKHHLVSGYNTRDESYDKGIGKSKFIEEPDFSCFVVDPIMFVSKFGLFDEHFTPAYFEDNDMHYRIKLAGGIAVKHTQAPFFHQGSVTQNWGGETVVDRDMFEKNREYYKWKWGGVPGEETLTTPNAYEQDEEEGLGI